MIGFPPFRMTQTRQTDSPAAPPRTGRTQRTQRTLSRVRFVVVGLVAFVALQACAAVFDLLSPPDLGRSQRSSPVALDRRGAWLRALPVENGRWRIRADLQRLDSVFVRRVIAVEDARFAWHPGVDPLALVRAAASAARSGRIVSGGSTVTMQTARLLEPRPRTLPSKLIEIVRAVQLEARLSKREILALYLTLAPYGGNLEGARAASLAYFGHEPESLTDAEQALLIALPQAPEGRRPDRRPAAARAARQRVLAGMVRAGLITAPAAAEAAAEPAPGRSPFPSLAWHAAGRAAANAPAGQASVVTTIDGPLQRRLEAMAVAAAQAQGASASAAILVVEVRGRAVRAQVASAGLDRPGGWVDMTRAVRSPGSTLKPFIYAMAFEGGLAAPDTVVDDSPRRFRDYQPENFDRVFHGRVSIRDALTNSLNVPAVEQLDRIGPAVFEARLRAVDVHLVRPRSQGRGAGLALALGGAGMTLQDLAVLYAALADGGVARPLAFTEADALRRAGGGVRLVRAEAAEQVLDILRETPAPQGRIPAALARQGRLIAFKTGTSYGFRDALAVGVVGGHVIVVWTGRPDGGARVGWSGRDAALPLLFDVADVLNAPDAAARSIAPREAPRALQRIAAEGPRLIFPPDGSTVQVAEAGAEARGLVLAARGEGLSWYADGVALPPEPGGRVVWRPATAGFYRLMVVDAAGRRAVARVRVRAGA